MKVVRVGVCLAFLAVFATRAEAIPVLQLDILGGHYDHETQTIVSDGKDFTLVALLTPRGSNPLSGYLDDTYYISAAVTPNVGPEDTNLGSFTWNGTNYLVTEDMTFGTPPLETTSGAETDAGDLSSHGTFPSFFAEFSFQFSPENRTVTYDSAQNPGGLQPTTATTNVSYFATFNITTSLVNPTALHFDLYNSYIVNCKRNNTACLLNDEDINTFAPFSHDAQSSTSVPEPQSLLLLAAGLLLSSRALKRKPA